MVNVDGLQPAPPRQTGEEMKQDNRIAAAGQAHRQRDIRRQAVGEKTADPLQKVS